MVNAGQQQKSEAIEPCHMTAQAVEGVPTGNKPEMVGSSSSTAAEDGKVVVEVDSEEPDENVPLIGLGECRICQEEDLITNLESPCACTGSLKVDSELMYHIFLVRLCLYLRAIYLLIYEPYVFMFPKTCIFICCKGMRFYLSIYTNTKAINVLGRVRTFIQVFFHRSHHNRNYLSKCWREYLCWLHSCSLLWNCKSFCRMFN